MSAVSDPLEVCVKAFITVPNKLGDCPFCQRVLLPIEEKHLPYDMKFLKLSPEGKVPVIKLEDKWVPDSDIFSTFIGFLNSKDASDGIEQALLNELSALNDHIKENGLFINGEKVSAFDLSLGPRLYHLEIALGHYKKWLVRESVGSRAIFSLDSLVKTRAFPEEVIAGWRPKLMG
ncbi:hypothetical protein P3X46_029452 [Hevea brasiliensis]|uniref:glutathione transferase n=1 Tax=Hevea brasiliensis TaxID=3981 RepID=A0ABQ9KSS2_HEVBR|nr:hypothetical protein P3X46_029452 [Hevea brasiliensis]